LNDNIFLEILYQANTTNSLEILEVLMKIIKPNRF